MSAKSSLTRVATGTVRYGFILGLVALAMALHVSAAAQLELNGQEIVIWPNDQAPNVAPPAIPAEQPAEFDGGNFVKVTHPRLYAYPLLKEKRNGVALLICPGGAYVHIDYGWGRRMQDYFSEQGVTVFILKYRLTPPSKSAAKDALADATRAMQIIRSRASEWGINPNRIGMTGHSAGANLTLNTATHIVAGDPNSPDPVLKVSSRPDFIALCSTWAIQSLKNYPISKTATPPVIMFHAQDDTTAPVADAEKLNAALQAAGVPVESHWIDKGGHMICSNLTPGRPVADWCQLTIAWLKQNEIWSSP